MILVRWAGQRLAFLFPNSAGRTEVQKLPAPRTGQPLFGQIIASSPATERVSLRGLRHGGGQSHAKGRS